MPSTQDAFLGKARHRGNGEAGSISGRRGIGNVRQFGAEINLKRIDGVHWHVEYSGREDPPIYPFSMLGEVV
jgi:hypothetical protein